MDSELELEVEEQESGRNPLRERMKQLEAENAALKARADEAASAARELAFVKAGVDPNLPVAKYFVKAYDGELTADAIRAAAIEAAIIHDTKAAEKDAWDRTSKVASGNNSEPPVDLMTRIGKATSQAEIEMLLSEARQAQQPY
jgi:hypothetical protein